MKQYINCFPMQRADQSECPSLPPSGCIWLKSKKALPKTLKMLSVTTPNGSIKFDPVEWGNYKYTKTSGRIPTTDTTNRYYTLKNTSKGVYLYIYTETEKQEMLKSITVGMISENPQEALACDDCSDTQSTECNPLDVDFYTCAEVRDLIFKTTWQTLASLRSSAIVDERNDDRSDDRRRPPQQ